MIINLNKKNRTVIAKFLLNALPPSSRKRYVGNEIGFSMSVKDAKKALKQLFKASGFEFEQEFWNEKK
jgi:hypothetical protein